MPEQGNESTGLSRRALLRAGALGAAGVAAVSAAGALAVRGESTSDASLTHMNPQHHGVNGAEGKLRPGGFDPSAFITAFDYGKVSTLPSGQTLREFQLSAVDREIEIAPGVFFPAWTYNGQVPGPTLRC